METISRFFFHWLSFLFSIYQRLFFFFFGPTNPWLFFNHVITAFISEQCCCQATPHSLCLHWGPADHAKLVRYGNEKNINIHPCINQWEDLHRMQTGNKATKPRDAETGRDNRDYRNRGDTGRLSMPKIMNNVRSLDNLIFLLTATVRKQCYEVQRNVTKRNILWLTSFPTAFQIVQQKWQVQKVQMKTIKV